jgi:hypothetical protein
MELKTWSVNFDMEETEKPVQKQKKKRSHSDKIGPLKYNQQLLKQTLVEVGEVKLMLRTIFAGLKGSFNFEQSLIERVACEDTVDGEILQALFEAGSPGLLPREIARAEDSKNEQTIGRRVRRAYCREERLALGAYFFCGRELASD